MSAGNAASALVVARAETGSGRERTATGKFDAPGKRRKPTPSAGTAVESPWGLTERHRARSNPPDYRAKAHSVHLSSLIRWRVINLTRLDGQRERIAPDAHGP